MSALASSSCFCSGRAAVIVLANGSLIRVGFAPDHANRGLARGLHMIAALRVARIALVAANLVALPAWAQTDSPPPPEPVPPRSGPSVPGQPPASNRYSPDELVDAGHHCREGGQSMGPTQRLRSWRGSGRRLCRRASLW